MNPYKIIAVRLVHFVSPLADMHCSLNGWLPNFHNINLQFSYFVNVLIERILIQMKFFSCL